jgi:Tol biopolymer transport system component
MRGAWVAAVAGAVVAVSAAPAAPTAHPHTQRVSVSATGEQGNGLSSGPFVSADGRYAAFSSDASNLVEGDTNAKGDVFVRDLRRGTVERVSVSTGGAQGDAASSVRGISRDGRYVLFASSARTLVPWDTPPADAWAEDVYLHDRRTRATRRVSAGFDGGSAYTSTARLTPDGRHIVFGARVARMEAGATGTNAALYLLDRRTGDLERISDRERFESAFVEDITPDGRYVAYTQVYRLWGSLWVHDRRTGEEKQVNLRPDGTPTKWAAHNASLSADGRLVAFQYDDVDLLPGAPENGSEVYVRDLRTEQTRRVDLGPGEGHHSGNPKLSPDGRYVAYETDVWPDPRYQIPNNIHVRDLRTGATRLVTETLSGGTVPDGYVTLTHVGRAAKVIGYSALSDQLVPGDTNGQRDAFLSRR